MSYITPSRALPVFFSFLRRTHTHTMELVLCWTREVLCAVDRDDVDAIRRMVKAARDTGVGAPVVYCRRERHERPAQSLFEVACDRMAGRVASYLVSQAKREWRAGGRAWWLFGGASTFSGEVVRHAAMPDGDGATLDFRAVADFLGDRWREMPGRRLKRRIDMLLSEIGQDEAHVYSPTRSRSVTPDLESYEAGSSPRRTPERSPRRSPERAWMAPSTRGPLDVQFDGITVGRRL